MKRLRPAAPRSLKIRGRARRLAVAALIACLLVAAPALGAFPGTNPGESVRINTPNDPDFDRCEPDDEQGATCTNVFDQQLERFGFAPNGSQLTALYKQPDRPPRHAPSGAEHAGGPQPARPGVGRVGGPRLEVLDRRAERAGRDPRHRHPLEQRAAAQEGRAQPRRAAAAADNGASTVRPVRLQLRRRLQRRRLRERPARVAPRAATTTSPAPTRPRRQRPDRRVQRRGDDDGNGYVDDIAGWDFFDDDNNPYDASSYSSASQPRLGPRRGGRAADATRAPAAPASAPRARSCRCASGTRSWSTRTTSRRPSSTRPTTTSRSSRARSARCSTRASRARRSSTPTARACSSRSSRRT